MRGDQLVCPWWLSRDIAASPDGLTIAEIAVKSLFQKLEWAFFIIGGRQRLPFSALRTQHSALFC
jgi:hypothetical protein